MTEALDIFAPLKTFSGRRNRHPWFTPYHRALVRESERLYRRYRRSRFPSELLEYRRARDHAHEQIGIARLDFYWRRLKGLTEPREIWKELRHLGIVVSPEVDLANFSAEDLNVHFTTISFDAAVPTLSTFFENVTSDDCGNKFDFSTVDFEDVGRAVNKSTSQAVGVDDLPQSFIKSALPSIGPALCAVFNKSLSSSTVPDEWKRSLVMALNKVPSPKCLGDFRPISLLCFLSKTLERVVAEQISDFVESNSALDDRQSAYRTGHSTQTALLKLTDDIRQGMDRRLMTALILFDFSKAFDTVSHAKLLGKLQALGFSFRVLKWVESYLSGRTQAVRMLDSTVSSFRPLNKGVPQGSVLGPLLFILFTGDIAAGLDPGVQHIVYADDLQVYIQGRLDEIKSVLQRLTINAARVADWAVENELQLNMSKTKVIVFGTPNYVNRFNETGISTISVGDAAVSIVSSVRSLGVILDSKLDWKEHVLSLSKRANSLMYRLYLFRRSTTFELRRHLVMSLLFPIVDYCSLVYCGISGEQGLLIQRIINKGIRYIFGVRRDEHITSYRRQLGWLTAAGRRDYFAACLMYKVFRTRSPSYLASMFLERGSARPVRGSGPGPLVIPNYRTESLKKSFHISYSYFWNSLPSRIRSASSIAIFKSSIYNHIYASERAL